LLSRPIGVVTMSVRPLITGGAVSAAPVSFDSPTTFVRRSSDEV
jgi:hypothetical protein